MYVDCTAFLLIYFLVKTFDVAKYFSLSYFFQILTIFYDLSAHLREYLTQIFFIKLVKCQMWFFLLSLTLFFGTSSVSRHQSLRDFDKNEKNRHQAVKLIRFDWIKNHLMKYCLSIDAIFEE